MTKHFNPYLQKTKISLDAIIQDVKMTKTIFVITLIILAQNFSFLYAQVGMLDNSFDSDGIATLDINNSNDVMKSIIIQSDGKIIVAGYTSDMVTDKFCLVRFNTNGTLDYSFGANGIVITNFPYTSIASDITLQPDGKIIVTGHTWSGTENVFALARYHSDGTLDTTFGSSGLVTATFSGKNVISRAVKIQNDGKIVCAGHAYTLASDWDEFALARFKQDGTPDSTFGIGGQVTTNFGISTKDWINSIEIQNDGKIIAGGFSNDLFALARYQPNGDLDLTFGSGGLKTSSIPNTTQSVINSLALSPDGSIFAGGFSTNTLNDFTIVKYDSLGVPDPTFGINGILVNQISTENDDISDLLIQPNGTLLAAGNASDNGVFQFALAKYDSLGNSDNTFGTNGVVKTLINPDFNQLQSIAIQSDGKIVATGFISNFPYDLAVVRYNSNIASALDEEILLEDVFIYPNPAIEKLFISFTSKHSSSVSLQLYNIQSQLLQEKELYATQGVKKIETIPLEIYSAGIYFIKITTPYGNQMVKIIKK